MIIRLCQALRYNYFHALRARESLPRSDVPEHEAMPGSCATRSQAWARIWPTLAGLAGPLVSAARSQVRVVLG